MEQATPEYKVVQDDVALLIFGLLITGYEDKSKNDKIEVFLTKELNITAPQVYQILLNYTNKTKPKDYESYFSEIQRRIIVNSYSLDELKEKAKKVFKFAQKTITKESLRSFCKLQ